MLGQIDFSSPLFATFADARFSDFSSIRFNQYRRLTLDEKQADAVRVVARFDSGSPAVLEYAHPSGGRIVVLATGWHPDDSQWALSTRFPPMIQRLVANGQSASQRTSVVGVGHRMCPAQLTGSDVWTLTRPDGTPYAPDPVTVAPDSSGNVAKTNADSVALARSVVLDQPGRWTLSSENSEGPQSVSLLVTVAASESRTEPLAGRSTAGLRHVAGHSDRARSFAAVIQTGPRRTTGCRRTGIPSEILALAVAGRTRLSGAGRHRFLRT